MSIVIMFTDLRSNPSILIKKEIAWNDNLTAHQAMEKALGTQRTTQIADDSECVKDLQQLQ
jgi:hypothetical protein